MYEEQIDGLADIIMELIPDQGKAFMVKQWVNGTVNDIVLAERKRAKEIVLSCLERKLP
jgi:hypothetical protein